MAFSPLKGAASTVAPQLPPAKATWVVDVDTKTSTATILGGAAAIWRRDDTGKFAGSFDRPEDANGGKVGITIPLHDCDTLFAAQQRMELLIRESLSKTHPELAAQLHAAEQAEAEAAAGPDPF